MEERPPDFAGIVIGKEPDGEGNYRIRVAGPEFLVPAEALRWTPPMLELAENREAARHPRRSNDSPQTAISNRVEKPSMFSIVGLAAG